MGREKKQTNLLPLVSGQETLRRIWLMTSIFRKSSLWLCTLPCCSTNFYSFFMTSIALSMSFREPFHLNRHPPGNSSPRMATVVARHFATVAHVEQMLQQQSAPLRCELSNHHLFPPGTPALVIPHLDNWHSLLSTFLYFFDRYDSFSHPISQVQPDSGFRLLNPSC